jgi:hypothetical protein
VTRGSFRYIGVLACLVALGGAKMRADSSCFSCLTPNLIGVLWYMMLLYSAVSKVVLVACFKVIYPAIIWRGRS